MTSLDLTARSGAAIVLGMVAAAPAHASEQLELMPDWTGALPVLIVAFVLVTLLLDPLIFKPLMRMMDEREAQIEGARRRADKVQQQAEESLARYEESIAAAHQQSADARRRRIDAAREELMQITREAKEQAEREIARARQELSGSVAEARESLREAAGGLAGEMAQRILGRES